MNKTIALIHGEANTSPDAIAPFRNGDMNTSYAHFAQLGEKYDVVITLSSPALVALPSLEVRGWTYDLGALSWKQAAVQPALFYDRFKWDHTSSQESALRGWLFGRNIGVNHLDLERKCKDKFFTWQAFPGSCIPTFLVRGKADYAEILSELGAQLQVRRNAMNDLSLEYCVVKNREGSGGEGISREAPRGSVQTAHDGRIVQPYLDTARGIPNLGITRRHDLRIIVVNGKPVVAEARVMRASEQDKGMFFPKSHTADTIPIALADIPERYFEEIVDIDYRLASPRKTRIYSVDFGQGASGRPWVFELNSRPQQTWASRSQCSQGDSEALILCRKQQQEAIVQALAEDVHGS